MTPAWRWVGERALLRAFPDPVPESNVRALALASRIEAGRFTGVVDLVPGARSLLVMLDGEAEPTAELLAMLDEPGEAATSDPGEMHEILVRYGGEDGPDLAAVATHSGLSEAHVIAMHSGATYTVGFIGFSPGFPYLLGMPEALAMPRLETPRTRIPAGSVGIGGAYTGVYPQATPGGWRLIGRTDQVLFDPSRVPPAVLSPGATVRLIPA